MVCIQLYTQVVRLRWRRTLYPKYSTKGGPVCFSFISSSFRPVTECGLCVSKRAPRGIHGSPDEARVTKWACLTRQMNGIQSAYGCVK